MLDLLKGVDVWFLVFVVFALCGCVSVLGGYFIWSMKGLLYDLKASIRELKETIKELFEDRNDHENRITILETRMSVCESCNGHGGHAHRRSTDEMD